MDLRKYIGHNVEIISISGNKWQGKAEAIDLAVNSEEMDYDELLLAPKGRKNSNIAFPENEIKSIKIL